MYEPLVIKRMKRLAELDTYVNISAHTDTEEKEKYFCVYTPSIQIDNAHHSYPKTYKDLLTDLSNRIIQAEAANDTTQMAEAAYGDSNDE